MNPIKLLWKYRRILLATTLNDIQSRFRGTVLGAAWSVLYPVLFLGLYAVIYTMIFRVRAPGFETTEYVLLIFCGLIPFLGFSEALGAGVTSVISNKGLIKNTLFPIELIPVKSVLASSVTMMIGLVLLFGALFWHGIMHTTQTIIPLIILLQLLFTVGLIWTLSALNVFMQDLGQMTAILIIFLMLVSPIAYTHDMIPPELMPFMYPNPLFYLIMLYRDALFLGTVNLNMMFSFTLISSVMFFAGGLIFFRLKPLFADYV